MGTQPEHLKPFLNLTNKDRRPREYLYEKEVEALMEAAKQGRCVLRDQALVLTCFRHGLRPSEACELKWSQIDFEECRLHVVRKKGGKDSVHPLRDREIRLLKRLYKQRENSSPWVFVTNRGGRLTIGAFGKIMLFLGIRANLLMPIHPYQLRHSTGYKLANDGVDTRTIQDYLGHTDIRNTVRYTMLSSRKFDNLFLD